ncbi:MAG: Aspartate aminotransferase [Myxococcota bacterium]|nr:Aspartate aminotransferase [Myxococcota bacterium]
MTSPKKALSAKMLTFMEGGSWIRRMFQEGTRLKQQHGADKVFDFSLGNPANEPPALFMENLRALVHDPAPHMHSYMPNAGFPRVRTALAEHLSREHGFHFTENHVLMTVGAAGALNCALKAILDPGDEVIVLAPYFVEYKYYIDNHDGRMVAVKTTPDFLPDIAAIESALTPLTRAIIINSPNNPTGRLYPEQAVGELGKLLARHSEKLGRPVYLISDEPYVKIIYDHQKNPSVFQCYPNTILCTSYSKDLALAGERIGFAAVHPQCEVAHHLFDAMVFANRILGFVNAPALMQRAIMNLPGAPADIEWYRKRRDLFVNGLRSCGYEVPPAEGAFYLFPKSPTPDDIAFVNELKEELILVVPGAGFGAPGHVRISYSVPEETIHRALPGFHKVARKHGLC